MHTYFIVGYLSIVTALKWFADLFMVSDFLMMNISAKDIGNLYMEHLVGYLKKWLNVQVIEDMPVQCLLNTALYLSDWQKEVDIE